MTSDPVFPEHVVEAAIPDDACKRCWPMRAASLDGKAFIHCSACHGTGRAAVAAGLSADTGEDE